jgi:hypothetical protein
MSSKWKYFCLGLFRHFPDSINYIVSHGTIVVNGEVSGNNLYCDITPERRNTGAKETAVARERHCKYTHY